MLQHIVMLYETFVGLEVSIIITLNISLTLWDNLFFKIKINDLNIYRFVKKIV